ncbi:hypothetical protein ACTFTM_14135 [Micromonospora sp. RB23]
MSPLARPDVTGTGSLGRCRIHRKPLPPERHALAEPIATERLAAEEGEVGPSPLPRPSRRRGTCPDCTAALAAGAWAFLNGDDL